MFSDDNKWGIFKRHRLTDAEITATQELNDICNAYEELHLKLDTPMLQAYSEDEVKHVVYYTDSKLRGFLTMDGEGIRDREVVAMVHPDYRCRGIFSALLATAVEICQEIIVEKLLLICETTSSSGKAALANTDAQYEFAEHHMQLETLHERPLGENHVTLAQALPRDLAMLSTISAASFGRPLARSQEIVVVQMQEANRQFYMANLGQEPIGLLNLYTTDKAIGIYGFGVHPRYQGKGYGRQILQQIIQLIRSESQKLITLEVDITNTNAVGLYRSCGFREVNTYEYYSLPIDLGLDDKKAEEEE